MAYPYRYELYKRVNEAIGKEKYVLLSTFSNKPSTDEESTHGDWDLREDSIALQLLQPDIVLFTGRFLFFLALHRPKGILVKRMWKLFDKFADLRFSKAIILGNHDAWYTQEFFPKRKDGVQLQLECIVGGRPFSHGGAHMFRRKLILASFGVKDMKENAKRIYDATLRTPEGHALVFLAHNGPTDWVVEGGDFGDQDLEQATSRVKQIDKLLVPLVVFGHMHKELARRNGHRKMTAVGPDDTIYMNGAIVPRIKSLNDHHQGHDKRSSKTTSDTLAEKGTKRTFIIADLSGGRVDKIAETWVSAKGDVTQVEDESVLYERSAGS